VFWTLARNLHPDAGNIYSGGDTFARLKADYDKAARMLPAVPPQAQKKRARRTIAKYPYLYRFNHS
jgi:hypothetical protein